MLGRFYHIGAPTEPKPLPDGEGLGWGFGAVSRARRQTPTPLRLGGTPPSLTAPLQRRGGLEF